MSQTYTPTSFLLKIIDLMTTPALGYGVREKMQALVTVFLCSRPAAEVAILFDAHTQVANELICMHELFIGTSDPGVCDLVVARARKQDDLEDLLCLLSEDMEGWPQWKIDQVTSLMAEVAD